ncbi:MAG: hypothetical protein KatS3mg105_4074 [Gemmatales bacterium]|nr:MAG: hypothetical protein KatS3mg105_4074 [Gemmatales bacterium]
MNRLPYVPGYQIVRRLGGGPMTVVYQAFDSQTGENCAIKLMRDDWEDKALALKLLQREARVGLKVRHPNLVRILKASVTRPPCFLVMELLAGESLRRRLQRDFQLDLATALWIIRQITDALLALHRHGFVHADVKPENIRLLDNGSAKLIDLGFAHRPGENAAILDKGYILGTANYLAPECCLFDNQAGPNSDIFSLGITFFEMLAGRLPYRAGSIRQTLLRHAEEEPENLRQYRPDLPSTLCSLVQRMLSRDPQKRPRAGALIQQLIALEISSLHKRRSA